MVKTGKINNTVIATAFKDVQGGQAAPLLTPDEENLLERTVKKLKAIPESGTLDFKDEYKSQIIFVKIPDNKAPIEKTMPDGTTMSSVSVLLQDSAWSSFLTNDEDTLKAIESHYGCAMAVVGQLKKKVMKDKTEYWNIKNYRGAFIFENELEDSLSIDEASESADDLEL